MMPDRARARHDGRDARAPEPIARTRSLARAVEPGDSLRFIQKTGARKWTRRQTMAVAVSLFMAVPALCAWSERSAAATDVPASTVTARGIVYPEIAELVKRVSSHPDVLLRFVSQRIAYEPYQGALRGPRGTLLAAAGNSADQALLLRDLLGVADPKAEVQFAFGTLSSTDGEALVRSFLAQVGSAARRVGVPELQGETRRRPAESSARATDQRIRALVDKVNARWASLVQKVQTDTSSLGGLLQREGVVLNPSGLRQEALLQAARQHVWLQYRTDGRWVDLDPTIPDGTPGARRTVPTGTSRTLPEGLYHHLGINVRLEERQQGRLTTRYLLRTLWRTAEIAGSNLTYVYAEPLGFTGGGGVSGESADAVRYTPLLLADTEYRRGSPVTLPRPVRSEGVGAIVGSQVGQILGGGLPGMGPDRGGGASVSESSPQVTGLWLETVATAPDGSSDKAERPVLDRIGYVERSSGHAATATLTPLDQVNGHYSVFSTVSNIAISVGETVVPRSLLRSAPRFSPSMRRELYDVIEDLGELHRSFYRLRSELYRSAGAAGLRRALMWRPNVSLLSWGGAGDSGRLILDLLSSPVEIAARPADTPTPDLLWAESSVQAEHLTLHTGEFLSGKGKDLGPPWTTSFRQTRDLASVFESSERDGIPSVVVRPGSAGHDGIGGSPEAQARLRARRNEGLTVVVPQRAANIGGRPFLGWWLIDPRTGFVIDELENGGHAAGVESQGVTDTQSRGQTEAINESWVDRVQNAFRRTGHKTRCLLMLGALITGGVQAASGAPPDQVEGIGQVEDAIEGIAAKKKEGSAGDPGETGECLDPE
jgi:hypothetical protein